MKKILIGLGTLASVAVPIAASISCGSSTVDDQKFSFTENTTKDQLLKFLGNNKDKEVVISLEGNEHTFVSDGSIPSEIEALVDAYIAKIARAVAEKAAKEAKAKAQREAEEKARAAKELAAKVLKAKEAEKDILKTDIAKEIATRDTYDSSTDVKQYNLPTKIELKKDGVSFDVEISNEVTDENGGRITFDATIKNPLLTSDETLTDIKLTGFEVNLDNEGKIDEIQKELDDDPTIVSASDHKTSSEITDSDIHSDIKDIVTNDYGMAPVITNIQRTSGEVTLDVTYEAEKDDGTKVTATKNISILSLVTDEEKADELQTKANEMKADIADYLYSWAGKKDSRLNGRTWMSETADEAKGNKIKLTADLMMKMGFDEFVPYKYNQIVDKFTDCQFQIDPLTMKVKFFITYNAAAATIAPTETVIYTQQMRNLDVMAMANQKIYNIKNIRAKSLPSGFTIPIGLSKLRAASLMDYKIPATLKIPDSITEIDQDVFAGCEIADGFKLPDTVTKIVNGAFEYATIPGSFKIPSGTDTIEKFAFKNAKISDGFTLPDTVKNINQEAFMFATIGKDFTMPKELDKIGWSAFGDAYIGDNITLPEHIKNINFGYDSLDDSVFGGSTLPSNIDISKLTIDSCATKVNNPDNQDKIDVLFGRIRTSDKKIPNYSSYLDKSVIGLSTNDKWDFSVAIPSTVRTIGDRLFYDTDIPKGFKLPDSITTIESMAFYNSKLPDDFKLPTSLKTIGVDAFLLRMRPSKVQMPTGFSIPDSVTSIGEGAFSGRVFGAGFTIGSGVTELKAATFYKSTFADDFVLPDTVSKLIDEPFKNAKLPTGFKGTSNPTAVKTTEYHVSTIYKMGDLKNNFQS